MVVEKTSRHLSPEMKKRDMTSNSIAGGRAAEKVVCDVKNRFFYAPYSR